MLLWYAFQIEVDDVILLDESEDKEEEEEEGVVFGVGDDEDIAELDEDDVAVTGPCWDHSGTTQAP